MSHCLGALAVPLELVVPAGTSPMTACQGGTWWVAQATQDYQWWVLEAAFDLYLWLQSSGSFHDSLLSPPYTVSSPWINWAVQIGDGAPHIAGHLLGKPGHPPSEIQVFGAWGTRTMMQMGIQWHVSLSFMSSFRHPLYFQCHDISLRVALMWSFLTAVFPPGHCPQNPFSYLYQYISLY